MSHGRETTIFHPATLSFKKPQSNGRRTDQAVGSGALLRKIERNLGTFDKLDMYSIALFKKSKFDRGRLATQRIDDLLDVRNKYVHPKVIARPAVHKDEAKKAITFHCGTYEYLKIDRSPRAWSGDQALTVLKAVDEFLTYYFLEHAEMAAAQATDYLIPRTLIDGRQVQASVDLEADLLYVNKARKELGIPFKFVR